ncbi:hypothetical protein [Azonexus sp.]|uniref:hypothetical protein n=1 Tax=Azonexus sp. TaxID=1872668 RepID=UPI0039E30104
MLAPLENRAILEREPCAMEEAADADRQLHDENQQLRAALQRARQRQKRLLSLGGRRSLLLQQEMYRLEQRCRHYQQRVHELESGLAIVELAQQVIALKEFIRELGHSCRHALAESP